MLRKALVASAVVTLAAGTLAVNSGAVNATARFSLGTNAGWARASARVGAFDATAAVPVRVYLNLHHRAEADAFVQTVSDPTSPSYHHYLTNTQFRARYSPTAADVADVTTWLRGVGLQIGEVPDNNLFVPALGSGAQIERAFGVHLGRYNVNGVTVRGADVAPSAPAALASIVAGVVGVDQSQSLLKPLAITDAAATPNAHPPAGFRNATPCSDYYLQKKGTGLPSYGKYGTNLPWTECKKTPPMLRKAYGIDGAVARGLDGRGVTVGIVDAFASPTIFKDAVTYSQRNDPQHVLQANQYREIVPRGIFRAPDNDPCDPQGWYGEETLDVEAVHAMAPGAKIVYSGGKSCQDPAIDAALNKLVDGHLVDMVSNSYGNAGENIPASEIKAFDAIATQAGAQGIGLYFSSGDEGDESTPVDNGGLGHPSTDFAASDPLVTAVGGTSMGIAKDGSIAVEQGWMTTRSTLDPTTHKWDPLAPGDFLYGSGGGTSRKFKEPNYQKGVVPAALAHRWGGSGRVVPDVAMLGDPNTGMTIGETQTFSTGVAYGEYRIGGTSLSCPLFAGFMALADQKAGFHHGFANPALYHLSASAFRDVKPSRPTAVLRRNFNNGENAADGYSDPSVRTFDTGGNTIHTAAGYDTITGRGVPRGNIFLNALAR